MTAGLVRLLGSSALALALAGPVARAAAMELIPAGSYKTGVYDKGAAEIVAFDPATKKLFVVNGADKTIDILDAAAPGALKKIGTLDIGAHGKAATSVAVKNGLVAVAVEAKDKQADGKLVLFKTDGTLVGAAQVGALPDMVTFTPKGDLALTANEGEPSKDYTKDPEGTVSIVAIPSLTVKTVRFDKVDAAKLDKSVHRPSPEGTSLAQDLEPEYVAVSPDGTLAFVTLQENNAIAVIDIAAASVRGVFGLGFKDFSKTPMDASDKDDAIRLKTWPVKSLYQPDSVAVFEQGGTLYAVTANEGDARDYEGYSEEMRVAKLTLDPAKFPNAAALQLEQNLGRLKVTKAMGDTDGDGDHDEIVGFGGRSFSIYAYDAPANSLTQVYDSGSIIAQKLAKAHPGWFNSEGQKANFDKRSDDKGTEPEGLAIGEANGKRLAFIGLERMGGIVVFDISNPAAPAWAGYFHNGSPNGDAEKGTAGDVAPEGLAFIPAAESPTGAPMLAVGNEVSGSTTLWTVK